MWQKIKLVLIILAVVMLMVVTLQNTQPTETNFLTHTYTMPQAAGLFLAGAIGFLAGSLATAYFMSRRRLTPRKK